MIRVNGCGHDSHHKKPCNVKYHQASPDYLFLLIKRDAWVVLDNKKQEIPANSCICFPPGSDIHYGCDTPDYNDDWLHFLLSPDCIDLLDRLEIPVCTPLFPRNFHKLSEYVRMITDAFLSSEKMRDEILDSFMKLFLYTVSEELAAFSRIGADQKYYAAFSALRTEIYNSPSLKRTVPGIADALWLSCSHFQHLYKKFFGCSCQQDMIAARLKLAKHYLSTSEMSIQNIADLCGYESEIHFMRQFKKYEENTPTQFRKQNR